MAKANEKTDAAQGSGAAITTDDEKIGVYFDEEIGVYFLEGRKAPMDEKIEVQGFALTREQLFSIVYEFGSVYHNACRIALLSSKGEAVAHYNGLNFFLTYSKDEKTDQYDLRLKEVVIEKESELQKDIENKGYKLEKITLPFGSVLF